MPHLYGYNFLLSKNVFKLQLGNIHYLKYQPIKCNIKLS